MFYSETTYQLRGSANHPNHYRSCHWQEGKSAFKWSVCLYLLKVEVEEEPHWYPCCPRRAITTLLAKRLDVLNMRKGMRGSLLRFCIITNAPNRPADVKSKDTVCGELRPASFAVTIA